MAYMCTRSNKECDGCGGCRPEPVFTCSACGEELCRGDTYFDGNVLGVEGKVFCKGCMLLAKETVTEVWA